MKRIQTRVRLGELYGVDPETITRWLHRIGITHSGSLTPMDLHNFVTKIGEPAQVKEIAERLKEGR